MSSFVLDDPFASFFADGPTGLRKEIRNHVFRNSGDWSTEYLFDRIGALDCSPRRFGLFVEGLASADVRPDVDEQQHFAEMVNKSLHDCSVELRETGTTGGYPVFTLVPRFVGVRGRPKNLIFASRTKPDIRFRDAVNNDIEILSGTESVLVYDRPIPNAGLLWRDLQDWWADTQNISSDAAKRTLYKRLVASLPDSSLPQRLLFEGYFNRFGQAIPNLPALLPEVWLHWDPKTVVQRGPDALLRFRMDFLMLLPNSVRVVIEVDGKQHYADESSYASPRKYGLMAAADRDLQLAGYDVYHFGADELCSERVSSVIPEFFERLFELYRVTVPS